MSGISTHVLDTALGRPAAAIGVTLARWELNAWVVCGSALTDADGRCRALLLEESVSRGRYRLTFETAEYFRKDGRETFFPEVAVTFQVAADGQSCHVPLLMSGFGYSTYRGS